MQLLVGLGNPGPSYARQRHNVGFMAADTVAKLYSFAPFRKKFHSLYSEGAAGGHKLLILKPQRYMNDSGRPVAEAAHFYKLAPEEIVVVHDEIDLTAGKVRAKLGGSSAGHNGLRSLDDYLGAGYWRIRIGVGRPGPGGDVIGYVLRNFARGDEIWLGPTLSAVAEALPLLLDGDAPGFMTKVALLANPPDAARPKKAAKTARDAGPDEDNGV
ncbi:MAG TPA: aminoacyl-tRNA hydrolase [Alphaproteobacteria bacterium]|jgi:PTH1 family peptidyl-tRNA hydrolase|nr:aminoacyl-tRNA hydrolase [Alphaproteobacteria bacterium]